MIEHPTHCILAVNPDPEDPLGWIYTRIKKMPLEMAIKKIPEPYSSALARIIPLFATNDPQYQLLSGDPSRRIVAITDATGNYEIFFCETLEKVDQAMKTYWETASRIDVLQHIYQYRERALEA